MGKIPGSKADIFPKMQAFLASKKCDNCARLVGDHTPKEFDDCFTKLLGPKAPNDAPCECGKKYRDHTKEELHECLYVCKCCGKPKAEHDTNQDIQLNCFNIAESHRKSGVDKRPCPVCRKPLGEHTVDQIDECGNKLFAESDGEEDGNGGVIAGYLGDRWSGPSYAVYRRYTEAQELTHNGLNACGRLYREHTMDELNPYGVHQQSKS